MDEPGRQGRGREPPAVGHCHSRSLFFSLERDRLVSQGLTEEETEAGMGVGANQNLERRSTLRSRRSSGGETRGWRAGFQEVPPPAQLTGSFVNRTPRCSAGHGRGWGTCMWHRSIWDQLDSQPLPRVSVQTHGPPTSLPPTPGPWTNHLVSHLSCTPRSLLPLRGFLLLEGTRPSVRVPSPETKESHIPAARSDTTSPPTRRRPSERGPHCLLLLSELGHQCPCPGLASSPGLWWHCPRLLHPRFHGDPLSTLHSMAAKCSSSHVIMTMLFPRPRPLRRSLWSQLGRQSRTVFGVFSSSRPRPLPLLLQFLPPPPCTA